MRVRAALFEGFRGSSRVSGVLFALAPFQNFFADIVLSKDRKTII